MNRHHGFLGTVVDKLVSEVTNVKRICLRSRKFYTKLHIKQFVNALEKFSKNFLFTLEVLLFCIIHPGSVAERCDSSFSLGATGLRCDRLHQKLWDTPAIGANTKVKNANTQNINTTLQTITGNFVTL